MEPSSVLLKLHEAARERGEDPMAFAKDVEVPSTRASVPEVVIERPNWPEVIRKERAVEREARITEAQALLESAEAPAKPDPPASKSMWRRS
jgi:hypothetical protein